MGKGMGGDREGMGGGMRGGPMGGPGDKHPSDFGPKFTGYRPLPPPGVRLPHAGEYLATDTNYYEIVYMPLQPAYMARRNKSATLVLTETAYDGIFCRHDSGRILDV
jgi:hypothetical protein